MNALLLSHMSVLESNSFQRLVSFMTDLRGADNLLQKAIKKVDSRQQLDTAQVMFICSQSDIK